MRRTTFSMKSTVPLLAMSSMIGASLPVHCLRRGGVGRLPASAFVGHRHHRSSSNHSSMANRWNSSRRRASNYGAVLPLWMVESDNDGSTEDCGNDTTNKLDRGRGQAARPFAASSPWANSRSLVGSLLERTTSRAVRTLSTTADSPDYVDATSVSNDGKYTAEPTVQDVLDAAIVRSSSVLDCETIPDEPQAEAEPTEPTVQSVLDATIVRSSSILDGDAVPDELPVETPKRSASSEAPKQHKQTYLGNPSVTPTALAHSLWQSTILPHEDTVIDATCGNGKDCLALAKMLFPDSIDGGMAPQNNPQLIGIDVQSRAVHNTQRSLLASLPEDVYYNHVSLLEQSHEHLMDVPRDRSSVGLVCYNLGYLPGAPSQSPPGAPSDYKECKTQTSTTLHSITDASLLLRVGGLLSIMTYPGSNLEESVAVEHFVEGLAMLTTRDPGGWRGYAGSIPDYDDDGGRVRRLVTDALERVTEEGIKKQTWRAFVHKPLGRPLSPVLATAMRIK